MIRILLSLIFTTLILSIYGQDSTKIIRLNGIGISYLGENLSHYGFKIKTEFPIFIKNKTKTRHNGNTINKQKVIFVAGNFGSYIHKRNNVALFVNSEIGYRKIRKKGFKYEFLLGLGYLHTFLLGDTYEVSDDGSINRVNLAGQSNLMVPFSFGIGYDFSFFYKQPFSININPGFFIQYPYNIAVAIRPTVEASVYYYFRKHP
jgi:hypothetical protein